MIDTKIYKSTLPDNFKWMKKGMSIENDPSCNGVIINGKKYFNLDQFERTYGPIISGDKLAKDAFWHVKTLIAWHDVIKSHILNARKSQYIDIKIDDLMDGHDSPKEYVKSMLNWWGFEVKNDLLNVQSSDLINLNPSLLEKEL